MSIFVLLEWMVEAECVVLALALIGAGYLTVWTYRWVMRRIAGVIL